MCHPQSPTRLELGLVVMGGNPDKFTAVAAEIKAKHPKVLEVRTFAFNFAGEGLNYHGPLVERYATDLNEDIEHLEDIGRAYMGTTPWCC